MNVNKADIDDVIERLKTEIPGVHIAQLHVAHLGADDNGLWIVQVAGRAEAVQVESSNGRCPFLIESDFSDERFYGASVGEVVSTIARLYSGTVPPFSLRPD